MKFHFNMTRAQLAAALGFDIAQLPTDTWCASHPSIDVAANEYPTEAEAVAFALAYTTAVLLSAQSQAVPESPILGSLLRARNVS